MDFLKITLFFLFSYRIYNYSNHFRTFYMNSVNERNIVTILKIIKICKISTVEVRQISSLSVPFNLNSTQLNSTQFKGTLIEFYTTLELNPMFLRYVHIHWLASPVALSFKLFLVYFGGTQGNYLICVATLFSCKFLPGTFLFSYFLSWFHYSF